MTFTEERFGGHPVAEFLHSVSEGAAKVAETGFWSLPDTDLKDLVVLAARARTQIEAIELRLVADVAGRGAAARDGAPSTQAWLRGRLRLTPAAAAGRVRLAAALERLPLTRDALTDGRISPAHAGVIAEAMAELPSDASLIPGPAGEDVDDQGSLRQRAEAHLVECATRFDPRQLRRLGHRIVEVVDPDAADAREAQKVADLEKRAYRRRELRFSDDGRGTVFLSGRLDVESAAVVRRALDPLAKPRPSADGLPDLRTAGCRLADALIEVSRRGLVSGGLPVQRGERPQIVVTVDYAKLRDQVGVGFLDTGEALSPATVRRLACDAGIVPAVLGGDSVPLDLGRTERLCSPAQRRALIVRDKGCAFPGCDRPPAWCDAHHVVHWVNGGLTDLNNCVLLCGFHHRVIHKGHWRVRVSDDGCPEFTPPRYIDIDQRPMRNTRPT